MNWKDISCRIKRKILQMSEELSAEEMERVLDQVDGLLDAEARAWAREVVKHK